MRVDKRSGYRVVVGGPVPPQAEAITLGKTIFVRKRSADHRGLMAHELVHVRQFGELGAVRFLIRYLGAYLRFRLSGYGHMAAYRRIPLEVEASWLARLHSMAELEPSPAATPATGEGPPASALVLRDRLGSQRNGATSARPVPGGGRWNRPSMAPSLTAVQAAMARRDANDSTSR